MITKEMIDRINFLSRKSRQEGLNEEEKLEQQKLRREYIDSIKAQVRQQLDNIEFVDDEEHHEGCTCHGDHEHHHHEHHHEHHCHDENCNCKKH